MHMRAVIVIRHCPARASPHDVGAQAVIVLESLPGVSEVRIDHEDSNRATISYRWKDPGVHSACIGVALASQGMQLI
jgi:hypothetical protein